MKTLLLYNPVAGPNRSTRERELREVCRLFGERGHETTLEPTDAAGSAAAQVKAALADRFEWIIACGGDGTVHDVLQGLVRDPDAATSGPSAILGVLPMGSANVLARHLGLAMSPLEAALQLLTFSPRLIPVGRIECSGGSRYFTVMAGVGPDGALVYRMLPGAKGRVGRLAYYLRAATLFASRRFASFELTWVQAGSAERRSLRAVGTMAVRIDDLGGLFSRLAPAARVHHPYLHLIAVRGPAWLSLPAWFAASWLGASRWNPLVEAIRVQEFTCTPATGEVVHVQADGEWIGTAPARVRLIPEAVRLSMPLHEEGTTSAAPLLRG